MKLTKNRYLQGFAIVVLLLAIVRLIFPGVAGDADQRTTDNQRIPADTVAEASTTQTEVAASAATPVTVPKPITAGRPHRIRSVASYAQAFPDSNALQLEAARHWGVQPVKNRADAEARKKELVYIGSSPYFHIDPLYSSIPYLVPRAAVLLHDMGQAFFDSLYVKGVPLHRLIVTSVLRTQDDVARLRSHNPNATENSCHLYGTTFDVCYNRYETVSPPDGPARRAVRNDTLKWVLAEVLRDFREQGRCYIKHEVKQGCFHMTVR